MTSRRAPDGPNRKGQSAQKSAFNGALGGALKSARPTANRNASAVSSTARNSLGLGGQIYRVADGVLDVADNDYLIDLGGLLWWKTPTGKWTHLFSGSQEYGGLPTTYKPVDAETGSGSDLFLGYEVGYGGVPGSGSNNIFIGYTNSITNGSSTSSVIGTNNDLGRFQGGAVIGANNDTAGDMHNSHIVGSSNGIASSHSYGSYINVFGSSNGVEGNVSTTLILGSGNTFDHYTGAGGEANGSLVVGDGNTINLSGYSGGIDILGSGNSLSGRVNSSFIFGGYNALTALDYGLLIGSNNSIDSADKSIAIGFDHALVYGYAWVLGSKVAAEPGEEEGVLVARKVNIHRSFDDALSGESGPPDYWDDLSSSLGLDDLLGHEHIISVDSDGVLLVDGSPIEGVGSGVPPGGTTNQVLTKMSATDGDADWANAEGINWLGTWSSATAYNVDDAVAYNGSSYIAILSGTNHQPDTSPTYWDLVAQRGADGTDGDDGLAGGVSRDTVSYTTASLADTASEDGAVTGNPSWRPIIAEADQSCRITLYVNTTYASADSSRPFGTAPTGDHGVLLDIEVDGGTPFPIPWVPTVYTVGMDSNWIRVTNMSGSTTAVAVSLTVLVDELP